MEEADLRGYTGIERAQAVAERLKNLETLDFQRQIGFDLGWPEIPKERLSYYKVIKDGSSPILTEIIKPE